MFFCRRLLKFSLASKWKDAGVGRHTISVELIRKNLIDLHWKYYRRHQKKNLLYLKQILSASVGKKNCTMSAQQYMSRLHNDRCRLLYFLFNPWIIFGWCLGGNVWSASSGDSSFLKIYRSSFLANVGYHFFRSVSLNHVFLPMLANVFLCKQMKKMPMSAETQLRLS